MMKTTTLLLFPAALFLSSCEKQSEQTSTSSPTREVSKKEVSKNTSPIPAETSPVTPPVVEPAETIEQSAPTHSNKTAGAPTPAVPKKPANITSPYILTDLSTVKVHPGNDSPKLGDTIYTYENIPTDACGEYWVMSTDGFIEKLAVCTHPEGH